ncbi:MAG: cold shock domain-containing protein [Chitinophagaceae bacterium]|nr:cold shock domain-containing protein [Chitinophagaceae bacterium]
MGETWNKKERERKRQKIRQDKNEKKLEKKENAKDGKKADDIAYVDENGNLSDTPPDPRKKVNIKLEDIEIGVPKYVPPTEAELTRKGKVTFFNSAKGFGFIKDIVTQESIFVHINNVNGDLHDNDTVTFEVEMGQRGPNAVNVKQAQ